MKSSHVHKLKRVKYKSGNAIFFCTLPDCNFKTNIALALGKRSICWRCGEQFIMSEYSLRLAKPHCPACHKPKNLNDVKLDEIITPPIELSLADRLNQTIKQAQNQEEDEL